MPVQITELNISVSVSNPGDDKANQPSQESFSENMIDECVEHVVRMLKDKKER
jgi:hypothetical protein